jgi:hypothetical protein
MWRLACVSTPTTLGCDKDSYAASLLVHSLVSPEPAVADVRPPSGHAAEYLVEVRSLRQSLLFTPLSTARPRCLPPALKRGHAGVYEARG